MKTGSVATLALILALTSIPAGAYTVYFKDGAQLIAKEPPEIRGTVAIITLQNGTQSSLPASEIDLERTRAANLNDLGSALILEGGEFTDQPTTEEPQREERLSDLIDRTGTQAQARRPVRAAASSAAAAPEQHTDLQSWRRNVFRKLEVAGEIQGIFRGQGVEQTRLYQGTSNDRVLIDLTTDSEAAVFRSLKVAAAALTHLQTTFPNSITAFELVLSTSSGSRAGQFVLDIEDGARLADGSLEPSTYFVDNVRF